MRNKTAIVNIEFNEILISPHALRLGILSLFQVHNHVTELKNYWREKKKERWRHKEHLDATMNDWLKAFCGFLPHAFFAFIWYFDTLSPSVCLSLSVSFMFVFVSFPEKLDIKSDFGALRTNITDICMHAYPRDRKRERAKKYIAKMLNWRRSLHKITMLNRYWIDQLFSFEHCESTLCRVSVERTHSNARLLAHTPWMERETIQLSDRRNYRCCWRFFGSLSLSTIFFVIVRCRCYRKFGTYERMASSKRRLN